MKRVKWSILIVALLLIATTIFISIRRGPKMGNAAASSLPTFTEEKIDLKAPLVKINGTILTAGELEEELNRVLISPAVHGGMNPQKRDQIRKASMEELIVRELAYQKARSLGLKLEETAIKESLDKIKARYQTDAGFKEALKAEGITEAKLRQRVERDLLLHKIHEQEIDAKARVGETEARKHYEDNKARFIMPESVQLKHIVIRNEPGRDESASRKKINEAYKKLKAGAVFSDVAYKYSEDDYRVMGGDFGSVHRGQIVPELEKAAFAAPLKKLVGPFQTSLGWHIIWVAARQAEHQLTFDEVKSKIEASLSQKRLQQRKLEFAKELRAAAQIKYLAANR
ncbi:MAG: peptidylprolyl isomerase [Acidobacteria bacterium]|nr:peptidylprolyl isomerase [Acidobacteriota bacterium]MBI3655758.1 peptidylprolyl isomerase [Acidobacteriota bacterium]